MKPTSTWVPTLLTDNYCYSWSYCCYYNITITTFTTSKNLTTNNNIYATTILPCLCLILLHGVSYIPARAMAMRACQASSMLLPSSPSPSEPTPTTSPPPTLNQPQLICCPNTYYDVSWLLCVVYLVDAMVSIIAQLIVVCNHLHDGCKWRNYSPPQRISTKPSASNITHGMWMTIVYSALSSPRHRPSDLLITHAYRKPPFSRWL